MDNLEALILKRTKLKESIERTESTLTTFKEKLRDLEKDISYVKGVSFGKTLNEARISDDEFIKLKKYIAGNPGILREILKQSLIEKPQDEGEDDEEI